MQPQNIRFSRTMAILLVVVGAFMALTSLLTEAWVTGGAGLILIVLGVLQLVNPALRIEPDEVQVRNPLGMTLKRFPVTSPADLRLEDKVLTHVPQGKKIASLGFGFQASDVEALRAQLAGGTAQPGYGGGQQWAPPPPQGQAPPPPTHQA